MFPYLEIEPLQRPAVPMKSSGYAVIQYDWYPYKRGYLDREPYTKREVIEESLGEDGHLQAKERSLEQILLAPSRGGWPAYT